MLPTPPTKIPVDRKYLEAEIRGLEAELELWKMHLDSTIDRGEQEVKHVSAFCMSQGYQPANPYLVSIAADYTAKANLVRLTIAKMEGQLMNRKALLEEGDKKVAVPGTF